MWILQIMIGSFWLFMGTAFLFREAAMWKTVEDIEWFQRRFTNSTTHQWERFCKEVGLLSFATGCLLFLTLPYGIGVLGVILFLPPLAFFL